MAVISLWGEEGIKHRINIDIHINTDICTSGACPSLARSSSPSQCSGLSAPAVSTVQPTRTARHRPAHLHDLVGPAVDGLHPGGGVHLQCSAQPLQFREGRTLAICVSHMKPQPPCSCRQSAATLFSRSVDQYLAMLEIVFVIHLFLLKYLLMCHATILQR